MFKSISFTVDIVENISHVSTRAFNRHNIYYHDKDKTQYYEQIRIYIKLGIDIEIGTL